MELTAAIRSRHMVRTFSPKPLDNPALLALLDGARRGPSAGNTQAVEFLVLAAPKDVSRYWSTTMTAERQKSFRWQSLLSAPALVLVLTRPEAYRLRYREPDKARTGLGNTLSAWPVPYWWVDAGATIQNLLLLAVDQGLGAALFGPFDHEPALKQTFQIPDDRRIVATVALGHPAAEKPGRSASRKRPDLDQIVHWGRWN